MSKLAECQSILSDELLDCLKPGERVMRSEIARRLNSGAVSFAMGLADCVARGLIGTALEGARCVYWKREVAVTAC